MSIYEWPASVAYLAVLWLVTWRYQVRIPDDVQYGSAYSVAMFNFAKIKVR